MKPVTGDDIKGKKCNKTELWWVWLSSWDAESLSEHQKLPVETTFL